MHKGEPRNRSRLGLSDLLNLTSSEGSTSDVDFLQETPTSSMSSRGLFHGGSSVGRRDKILVPSRFLNRQGSWNDMELLNVNNGFLD